MKDPRNDDGMTAALIQFRDLLSETAGDIIDAREKHLGASMNEIALFMIEWQQEVSPVPFLADPAVGQREKISAIRDLLRRSKTNSYALMRPYMDS